jgi:hypothetical protein
MARWALRSDIHPFIAQANTTRNYLVKYVEAATGPLLQTAINNALTLGVNAIAEPTTVHLVDIQYTVTGSGANLKHHALIMGYFTGIEEVSIWS